MRRMLAAIATSAMCLVALCCTLVGCSGDDIGGDFAGSWKVVEMSDSTNGDMSSMLDILEKSGKSVTLNLGADKSALFDMAGNSSMEGTWEATSATEATVSFDGYPETAVTIGDDGKLTFEEDGSKLVCEKRGVQE